MFSRNCTGNYTITCYNDMHAKKYFERKFLKRLTVSDFVRLVISSRNPLYFG